MHLSPKERFGYVALGAILLTGIGFVGAQKLKRPATIDLHETPRSTASLIPSVSDKSPDVRRVQQIVVHVAGAVVRPGLVSVPTGARVYDAILEAGGPSPEANIDAVNLAAKAVDGTQVFVPTRGGPSSSSSTSGAIIPPGGRSSSKRPTSVVDLNTASPDQLQSLPGIGKSMAQRIVDYRTEHGPFQVVDDLVVVQGFGKRRLEQVRPWLIAQ